MSNAPHSSKSPLVVAIGEALFDCFPDRVVLGGAPLNFIVHMQQLLAASQGQTYLVSRVGDDDLGRNAISELARRGVSTGCIQVDPRRPTGQVQVDCSSPAGPAYHIAEDVAWDYIASDDALMRLAKSASAVCFGTLAQRSSASRQTIQQFLAAASEAIKVLDVNLRQHHFTPSLLESSLDVANVAKLNEEELCRVTAILPERLRDSESLDDRAHSLREAFHLTLVAVTRGPHGTTLYSKEGKTEREATPTPIPPGADEVGAGDACCAGLVYGLLMHWPLERTLDLANQLGAYLVTQPGATPQLPDWLLRLAEGS